MEETGLRGDVGGVVDVVSDVTVLVREPVRLHSIRLIYNVTVEEATPRAQTGGSTGAVRWVNLQDLEAMSLIPWLCESLVKHL